MMLPFRRHRHDPRPAPGVTLSRVLITSVDDGLAWLRGYDEQLGYPLWHAAGDKARRRAVYHWRYLRVAHADTLRARGVPDDAPRPAVERAYTIPERGGGKVGTP